MQKSLGVPLKKLEVLLEIKGSAGVDVPYLGYTEVNLSIPEVPSFNKDVLILAYPDSKYSRKVPVVLGTLHVDAIYAIATEDESRSLTPAWRQGSEGRKVLAKQLSFHTGDEQAIIDQIDSEVKVTKTITIPARQAYKVSGIAKIPTLSE